MKMYVPPFNSKAVLAALILFGLICSSACFARSGNLIDNCGFEDPNAIAWTVVPQRSLLTSNLECIEGKRSLSFHHGQTPTTTELRFPINVGTGEGDLKRLETYLFSINAKVSAGFGNVDLIARTNNNPRYDQSFRWNYSGIREWQKLKIKFSVPSFANRVQIICRFKNTKGKCVVDWAQLVLDESLLRNGDFESDAGWVFNKSATSNVNAGFGNRSLKIFGKKNETRWASQFVNIGNFVTASDQPMYTISADVKTVLRSDWTPDDPPPEYRCNSIDVDKVIDAVPGSGAQIQVLCYKGGTFAHRISFPYFKSRSSKFTEQKFSFLLPEGTDSLRVALRVFDSNLTAFFENVSLTHDPVPLGSRVGRVGHLASTVEAPVPGTYFQIPGPTQPDLEAGIEAVTDPSSVDFGKTLWLPNDDYFFEKILLKRGLQIKIHRDAILKRDATGEGGFTGTFIRSHRNSLANPIADVVIEGGMYSQAAPAPEFDNNNLGSVVAISGDRIALRNLYAPAWSQTVRWSENSLGNQVQRANSDIGMYFIGNDVYSYHNTIAGPGGNLGDGTGPGRIGFDGMHYFGGSRAQFMGNQIVSGDDAIGIFTGTIPSNVRPCDGELRLQFQYNRNIADVEIYNCRLSSLAARAVACGIPRPRRADSNLTATVSNVRARNIVGRQSGATASLAIVASPRQPRMIFPDDECPSGFEAYNDNDWFPVRPAQVFDIKYEKMFLSVDVSRLTDGRPPQFGIRIYSEDVGSFANITLSAIRVVATCTTPENCSWNISDRPIALLQIKRTGLLCNLMEPDSSNPGQFVSAGFEAIGVSRRNFNINVLNCQLIDGSQFFARGYDIDSTEEMNAAATDVNSVADANSFPALLENLWTVKPDGIHN